VSVIHLVSQTHWVCSVHQELNLGKKRGLRSPFCLLFILNRVILDKPGVTGLLDCPGRRIQD
jgi:hypothetical protein